MSVSYGQAAQQGTTTSQSASSLDDSRAVLLLRGIVEQHPAARAVEVAPLGGVLPGGIGRASRSPPRSGRADAGSRRPSRRPGSRTPGPTDSPRRARWSGPPTCPPRSGCRRPPCSPCPGRGGARSTRTRLVPRSPSATSSPSVGRSTGLSGLERREVVGEHERARVVRVPVAVGAHVAGAQVAPGVVARRLDRGSWLSRLPCQGRRVRPDRDQHPLVEQRVVAPMGGPAPRTPSRVPQPAPVIAAHRSCRHRRRHATTLSTGAARPRCAAPGPPGEHGARGIGQPVIGDEQVRLARTGRWC